MSGSVTRCYRTGGLVAVELGPQRFTWTAREALALLPHLAPQLAGAITRALGSRLTDEGFGRTGEGTDWPAPVSLAPRRTRRRTAPAVAP